MAASIEYVWEPDPVELEMDLFAVAEALRDVQVPLLFAAQEASADIRQHFLTETDPSGQRWTEWSENYAPVALGRPNLGILRQPDAELYKAATDPGAFVIRGDTLFYDASGLPDYGPWHQEGRPDRKNKGGSANPLPKREFLGMSAHAIAAVEGTFVAWFEKSLDLFVTRTGTLGRRHSERGGLGRFIARSEPIPTRTRR